MRGNEKEHKSFLPHYAKLGTVVRWAFIYPDTRDLGASVNGRFFLETDCLNVILYLLLIYPIFGVLNPDGLFLP